MIEKICVISSARPFFQGAFSLRRSEGGPRPNRLWTPGAEKGLFRPRMHPSPMSASIPCSHTPIQGACVSLGGPGPMDSFSDVCEKLLQTRYITQSVVCAMMKQMASTHGSPMVCPYLLAICCHHPLAKQIASHQQRAQPDSYFPSGVILARIWMEFSVSELPNTLKSA